MNCRHVERLLSDRLDACLAEQEARALEAHLLTCAACRRREEEFRALGAALRPWSELPPPADVERRAAERWLVERRLPGRRAALSRPVLSLAVVAAITLLVCVAFARWGTPPRRDAPALQDHDFVTVPPPLIAAAGETADRAAAEALAAYQREVNITDARLVRKVTLGVKGTALSDLCEQLRAETGIVLRAGQSVADEKVTVFCREAPLRELMRQLSRPFGYTWLRTRTLNAQRSTLKGPESSGAPAATGAEGGGAGKRRASSVDYRYELVQDLRSQLMEEELRNRDRNAALLDVDRVMQGYRPYLGLSPAELRAHIAAARPGEAKIPAHLAGTGWGPLQLYSRLSPADVAALRAGETVTFEVDPDADERLLPPELVRGVLESVHDRRIRRRGDRFDVGPVSSLPDGLPPASVPEARAVVTLKLDRSELGEVTLQGRAGFHVGPPPNDMWLLGDDGPIAVGVSPTVRSPENHKANARWATDPDLRARVTVEPVGRAPVARPTPSPERKPGAEGEVDPRVTTADVLEALHKATGMNLVADYYTRLYPQSAVSVRERSRFDALNRLSDAMRLRWSKEGDWLRFRSASFFHDRLKEVPNRLLSRWSASRRKHGALTLEDLIEIGQLSDAQLDSQVMAEGAQELFDLKEWSLGRNGWLRPHWRYLATLTPAQREQAARPAGLPFSQLTLAQQQQFVGLVFSRTGPGSEASLARLEDLAAASLRVDYRTPGEFQWKVSEPPDSPAWRNLSPSPIRERDRESALAAARRIHPQATAAEIVPTELAVTFIYSLGGPEARFTPCVLRADSGNTLGTPPRLVQR